MEQKVDFVRIGVVIIKLEEILSIGILDNPKDIRVDFKNPSLDSVTVSFKNKVVARKDFESANNILCNPWVA